MGGSSGDDTKEYTWVSTSHTTLHTYNTLYYLSYIASKYGIKMDRYIFVHGHGKDVLDGLNAVDKHYLKQVMKKILHKNKI